VETFPFEATLAAEPPVMAPLAPFAAPGLLPLGLQRLMRTKNFMLIAGIGAGAVPCWRRPGVRA